MNEEPRDLRKEVDDLVAAMESDPRVQMLKKLKALQQPVTVSVTREGKVRRNGPCPCGSKKKFKTCCLRRTRHDGDLPRITKR